MPDRRQFEHLADVSRRCFEQYARSIEAGETQRIWYDLHSATIAVAYEEWRLAA